MNTQQASLNVRKRVMEKHEGEEGEKGNIFVRHQ